MKTQVQIPFSAWRFYSILFFILLIVLLLSARLIHLTVNKRPFLESQGNARSLRSVTESVFRGMILDRNGYPLAISTVVYSVWMNPQTFQGTEEDIKKLAKILNLKTLFIDDLIKRYQKTHREFVYLKRDVPPSISEKIKSLKISGINLQQDYKRFYPEGEVTAHIVGFTNIDDKGQEGLELLHDQWLTGRPGKKMVVKDRLGRVVDDVKNLQDHQAGQDLVLSINRRIQYLAYRELMAGVKAHQAESGSVVVLDVNTGEVLAMVNQPSFNPNNRSNKSLSVFRNRAVTDVFEPGSTIKPFSIASAFESGKYAPDSIIDTSPGWIQVGKTRLRDEHDNGLLSAAKILQISSNVGTTKMILSLEPKQLWDTLHKVGFGEGTSIGLPGERSGELIKRDTWSPITLATLAFGYGLSSTTLQLAQAYSVLANHGIKLPISILKVNTPKLGEPVMKATVADQMLEMLESVVSQGGTGKHAQIHGYRVAGKTGTAWIAGPKGYDKHRYVSSFVGIAPASAPRFVVAVVIRDPKGKQFLGGYVSGPVFKKIMEGTLHLSNVPPDENVEAS